MTIKLIYGKRYFARQNGLIGIVLLPRKMNKKYDPALPTKKKVCESRLF